jgi:hypothetical protein
MTAQDRIRLFELASFLIAHRPQLDYPRDDVRGPLDAATWKITTEAGMRRAINAGKTLCFDCSQSTTQLYRWAGLSDPNGLDYSHCGYTGTMLAHLKHYAKPALAKRGALVVFGPGTGEHVAMVLDPGDDPLLFSHGAAHVSGPIRLSVERTYHHRPVTFLNVSGL